MAVDGSWGRATVAGVGAAAEDRARSRAEAREQRAQERVAAGQARLDRRAAEREAAQQAREAARTERREAAMARLGRGDGDAPAAPSGDAPKRRRSGALSRTGMVEQARDTRHYRTVVDADRMRMLAQRGASVAGIAAAFGVSAEEVAARLAEADAE